MKAPREKLLETLCDAFQSSTEDMLALCRQQQTELAALRLQLQQANDRAEYWQARAVVHGAG